MLLLRRTRLQEVEAPGFDTQAADALASQQQSRFSRQTERNPADYCQRQVS